MPSLALPIATEKFLSSASVRFAASLACLKASIAVCLSDMTVQPWNFS